MALYLFVLFFSLLFIDAEHFGIFGVVFINSIAGTIIYLFYYMHKHENVHVDADSIQLRSNENITTRIPIADIQSFKSEDITYQNTL